MQPEYLAQRLWAARQAIVESVRAIADVSGQPFTVPASHGDLKPNLAAPIELQLLVLAELTAELAKLVFGALSPIETVGAAPETAP